MRRKKMWISRDQRKDSWVTLNKNKPDLGGNEYICGITIDSFCPYEFKKNHGY